jgi:hypothetical protein
VKAIVNKHSLEGHSMVIDVHENFIATKINGLSQGYRSEFAKALRASLQLNVHYASPLTLYKVVAVYKEEIYMIIHIM